MTQETYKKCDGAVAYFHLPGLFEFYGLYSLFLPLFYNHREYFYDWCEIGSIYGAPSAYAEVRHFRKAHVQQFSYKARASFGQKVQQAVRDVQRKQGSAKRRYNLFGPVA